MKEDPRFKKQPYQARQVKGHLSGATKKLQAAREICDIDEESAYELAYEAMLKASLALILREGLRPRSQPGHHVAIIEKAGEILGEKVQSLMKIFDEMRRNRNSFLYEAGDFVSSGELKEALMIADEYIQLIEKELSGKGY